MILIETKFIDYKCLQMRLARTRVAESAVCLDAHQPTQHHFILLSSGYGGLEDQVMVPHPPAPRRLYIAVTLHDQVALHVCEVCGPPRQPTCAHPLTSGDGTTATIPKTFVLKEAQAEGEHWPWLD